MRLTITAFFLTLLLSLSCQAKPQKPNVIYILADDLGYGDLSAYGQKKFTTPHIDRLATEGMKFTDHYSGNTVCSPSRAVLMTGQSPARVHVLGNGPEPLAALDPSMTTLPRLFKNAGYATGAFGKWGLGTTHTAGKQNPLTHGFDHFTGWKSQIIAHTYYPTSIVRDGKETPLEKGTYIHDLIMQDAFRFIQKNAKLGKPFFAYIPTAIPHAAMHAPQKLHDKWRKALPQFDNKIGTYKAGPTEHTPPVKNPIAGFAAMMEHLDTQVGDLLNLLKTLNIDNNTLILFSSDNGPHKEGGHDPKYWNSNGPLRGFKRDLYEGGIRAPFLVRWPGKIQAGKTSQHVSAFWDVLPTIAELIGQTTPKQTDGISFLPALFNKHQQQHDHLYWEFTHGKKVYARAARQDNWKAVITYPNRRNKTASGELELYDLSNDLGETQNLANTRKKIAKKMLTIIKNNTRK